MTRRVFLVVSAGILLCLAHETIRVLEAESDGNVAAEAELRSSNTIGLSGAIVRGPMPAEGADWRSLDRALLLGDEAAELRLDFGEPIELRAILIQADANHGYAVEGSTDEAAWELLWRVPALRAEGLRSRHRILPEAVIFRHLRIRVESGSASAIPVIGALRIYSEVPPGWPKPVRASSEALPLGLPWLGLRGIDVTKVVIASCAAVLLVLLYALQRRATEDGQPKALRRLLLLTAVGGFLGWWNFLQLSAPEYARGGRNTWDFYHYYMATKYAFEIGYTNLYRCTVAADVEDGFHGFQASRVFTRDLTTNRAVTTAKVMAEAPLCKDRFSPERWSDFKRDQAWFRANLPPIRWRQLPLDFGYNASPVWTMLGHALSNLGRMSDLNFSLLVSIDTVLLVFMWYLVWSTFGWLATCVAVVFWGANLVAGNGFTAGAFLRQGWLFLAVTGVCCLKRRRLGLAGFLLVYSTLLRVFPVFLLGGIAAKALYQMWSQRSFALSREHRKLLLGACAGFVALVGLSVVASGDPSVWKRFAANTAKYQTSLQPQALGLHAVIANIDRAELWQEYRMPREKLEASYQRPGRRLVGIVLAILFLPLLLRAVAGEEDWVASTLGLTWLPFVTGVSNYYWSILLLFGLLLADRRAVAPAFAAVMIPFSALGLIYDVYQLGLYMWSSLVLILFCLWVTSLYAWDKSRGAAAP